MSAECVSIMGGGGGITSVLMSAVSFQLEYEMCALGPPLKKGRSKTPVFVTVIIIIIPRFPHTAFFSLDCVLFLWSELSACFNLRITSS